MPEFRNHAYAAFLFDMDGTLLDSSAAVDRVWGSWAKRHGIDVPTLLATVHGVRSEDTIRRFAGASVDVATETQWILEAEVADVEGVVALPGIHAFIDALDPGTWAIVTSAPRALAEVRLRAVNLPIPEVMITAKTPARQTDPQGFCWRAAAWCEPAMLVFEDRHARRQSRRCHVAIGRNRSGHQEIGTNT